MTDLNKLWESVITTNYQIIHNLRLILPPPPPQKKGKNVNCSKVAQKNHKQYFQTLKVNSIYFPGMIFLRMTNVSRSVGSFTVTENQTSPLVIKSFGTNRMTDKLIC